MQYGPLPNAVCELSGPLPNVVCVLSGPLPNVVCELSGPLPNVVCELTERTRVRRWIASVLQSLIDFTRLREKKRFINY